jgi:metal-responsive CopG/Arc/MetJ family transcriptional regulator
MPRVNIVLPDELLAQIDQVAREEGLNRSQLIRAAFQTYVEQRSETNQRRKRQADIETAIEMQDRVRRSVDDWDPMEVLRQQRQDP